MNAGNFLQLLLNRSEKLTYTDSVDPKTQRYVLVVCQFFQQVTRNILSSDAPQSLVYLGGKNLGYRLEGVMDGLTEYSGQEKQILKELFATHSELLGEARAIVMRYNYERRPLSKEKIILGPGNLVRNIIPETYRQSQVKAKDIHLAYNNIKAALGLLSLVISNK